ncbi:MAG: thermonuclease family protein [Rhizobiaceae bacterium]|nr:thermonuclease family protein [Rhizobiaceae bacterium]
MRRGLVFLVALAIPIAPAAAQTVVGTAAVIDGDTIEIGETRVRLSGIDAPEGRQACERDGAQWACGEDSARQLRSLVEGRQVVCHGNGYDDYGRVIAACEAVGLELNRTMVQQGWAVAFRRYSQGYVADETRAKTTRLGIWTSTFALPEEWRAAHAEEMQRKAIASRPQKATLRPKPRVYADANGCLIKGNRNRKGQWIYHLPGMPYYNVTRPEDWFCTEAEAQAAGYRRAIVR